ncbi:MAG: response regulator transcription factor [Thermaerobacter sp.]|nr:response regulator transcription factor [Thermaerobacter sp.]
MSTQTSRILLIEDDAAVARLVDIELRHAAFSLDHQGTGHGGLADAASGSYDAVILDLSLPDIDGIEVCRALRALSDVPILILTARGSLPERVEGLDAGADDYLVKPFAPAELVARLRALLRRSRPGGDAPQAVVDVAALHVDALRWEAAYGGEPLTLTRREFELLRCLALNQDTALTRDMLLERVWGFHYGGQSNIVDVYVGYLRQKLTAAGAPRMIETVRGVGYRMRATEPEPSGEAAHGE